MIKKNILKDGCFYGLQQKYRLQRAASELPGEAPRRDPTRWCGDGVGWCSPVRSEGDVESEAGCADGVRGLRRVLA